VSSAQIPEQTPLFHALEKSRYMRQEQIRAIEEQTGRRLLVYFASFGKESGGIDANDIPPFGDLLRDVEGENVDLMLHSPGGDIDRAEKIVYMCRHRSKGFRVIVPESAKSAATLIALAADKIVMSYTSELGPIDPQLVVTLPDGTRMARAAWSFLDGLAKIEKAVSEKGWSPVYAALLSQVDIALLDQCEKAIKRSEEFANKWLREHMLKRSKKKAAEIASKLGDPEKYPSHSIVIDAEEADAMGLDIITLSPEDPLWQRIWRLYCMYEVDMRQEDCAKIYESRKVFIRMR